MDKLTNAEFTELAYNNHRDALLYLFARQNFIEAEHLATQETMLDMATAMSAPAVA